MPAVARGDHHGVDVTAGQQFASVGTFDEVAELRCRMEISERGLPASKVVVVAKNIGKRVLAVSGDNSQRTLMRGLKHMAALVVATIVLAGLCVWIIGWEENDADAPGQPR